MCDREQEREREREREREEWANVNAYDIVVRMLFMKDRAVLRTRRFEVSWRENIF